MERTLESRLAAIEAYQEIQQLAPRYARAVDSRNLHDLGELFSNETNFKEFGKGPEGARTWYGKEPVLRNFYRSFHQIVGHVITDIEETTARGTVYCRAEHEDGDNWVVILMVYFDRYVKEDGSWHFLGRRPRYLAVHDLREAPQAVGITNWPGRDRFGAELPQSDESWGQYWDDYPEVREKLTAFP